MVRPRLPVASEEQHERLIHLRPYLRLSQVRAVDNARDFDEAEDSFARVLRIVALLEKRAGRQGHREAPARLAPFGGFPEEWQVGAAVRILVVSAERGVLSRDDGAADFLQLLRERLVPFF